MIECAPELDILQEVLGGEAHMSLVNVFDPHYVVQALANCLVWRYISGPLTLEPGTTPEGCSQAVAHYD